MSIRVALSLVAIAFMLALLKTFGGGRAAAMPAPVAASQRETIAREIEAQLRETYDLSQPDVADRLLALYPDSGRVVSATGGQVVTTRDSLADGIRYFWENVGRNMREPRWEWERMIIDVLAPDAAVMTSTYRVPHVTPQGRPHVIGGAWTAVLVKRDGRWVIVQEHLSDLPAPVEAGDDREDDGATTSVDTTILRGP